MSSKREKEIARAKHERQQVRRSTRRNRARFVKVLIYSSVGLAALSFMVYQANKPVASADSVTNALPSIISAPIIDGCSEAATPRENNISFPNKPNDFTAATVITLATNCGDIEITADPKAPQTVGVMSYLSSNKFFDLTTCHRLTTDGIYVLQCGDPAGDGTGGPGFNFEDENLPIADSSGSAQYPRGTVAMANSGKNTNGSQFFLVYKDSVLPPNYSIWGTITKGLDRIDAVAAAGTATGTTDDRPAQTVVINTAFVTP